MLTPRISLIISPKQFGDEIYFLSAIVCAFYESVRHYHLCHLLLHRGIFTAGGSGEQHVQADDGSHGDFDCSGDGHDANPLGGQQTDSIARLMGSPKRHRQSTLAQSQHRLGRDRPTGLRRFGLAFTGCGDLDAGRRSGAVLACVAQPADAVAGWFVVCVV